MTDVLQAFFGHESAFEGKFHDFTDMRMDTVAGDPPDLLSGGGSAVNEGV